MPLGPILVCFAVKEEAAPFQELIVRWPRARVLLTGMGPANAEAAILKSLGQSRPEMVFSCGFAGGLNPALAAETIVFEASDPGTESALLRLGAVAATFHCANRVAVTASEKRALRQSTAAEAVEMESGVLSNVCRPAGIPFATVRVILDSADEDLPLDFNRLMNSAQQMDYLKLAKVLLASPGKMRELLRFQQRCRSAARKLASTLAQVISG